MSQQQQVNESQESISLTLYFFFSFSWVSLGAFIVTTLHLCESEEIRLTYIRFQPNGFPDPSQ